MARFQKWALKALLGVKLILFLLGMGVLLHAQDLAPTQIFEKVKASVVVVKVFNAEGKATSLGSGVKLPSGRIVTNFHVVKGGARFQVGQGDHFVSASIYAANAEKDLCLLYAPDFKAPTVSLGRASDLKVGAVVYAVGSPQGLELSLSNGIVSQLRGAKPPIIQTTAAISPGSSGGGLFDGQGRLVGITSFYVEGGQNLNFALPVEWVQDLRASAPTRNIIRPEGEWLAQAIKLEAEGKWPEMLKWCQAWVNFNGASTEGWLCLGIAYGGLQRYPEAIEAYRRSLKINPENTAAWANLGFAWNSLQRYPEAIEAYRQTLKIDPDDALTWYNLGVGYIRTQRKIEAIEAFRQTLRITPENAGAWYNLGHAYDDLQRYPEAVEAYRQTLKINSANAWAWQNLGRAYLALGRFADSIEASRTALNINPEDAGAWYFLGVAYLNSGNKTAALESVKQLRRLDPARADRLFDLIIPR